jgi:hypothetical protein
VRRFRRGPLAEREALVVRRPGEALGELPLLFTEHVDGEDGAWRLEHVVGAVLMVDQDGDERRLGRHRGERRDGEAVHALADADGDHRHAGREETQRVAVPGG